jgi:hypothetical protein
MRQSPKDDFAEIMKISGSIFKAMPSNEMA